MTQSNSLRQVLLVICLSIFTLGLGYAQNSNDAKEVTSTYYIKNAFVVQKPGTILPNTSILIKNGLIQSVGPNIVVPFDAQVIDADSMYVYAGFIDACTHAGIEEEDKKERPKVSDPGNPPMKLAGITPQKTVREAMGDKQDKSMGDLRDLGFGFAHVIPRGRMLPGQGSVISTGTGNTEVTLVKENISMFAQFKPARGMFPATTIGVMSQFRDLYKNAEYGNKYSKSYNLQPKGLERPNHSEELSALFPVVNKQVPVFFYTPKVKDVNRAMILNKELGFRMVLTGVRQGWPLLDDIIAGRHGVVLSLHLPEKIEDPSEKKDKAEEEKEEEGEKEVAGEKGAEDNKEEADDKEAEDDKEEATMDVEKPKKKKKKKKEKEDSPEVKALKAKKKVSHDEYVGQAGLLEKKGISFSFSSLDTKSKDIKPNILRMVKGGLSEKGALAALTTNAATLLGISNVAGTIEQGKIANLFITDKSYFDEESKIKFLINDGTFKEFKEKKKKKKGDGEGGEDVKLEGSWSYSVEIPGGEQSGVMIVKGSRDDLEIQINSSDQPDDFTDGTNIEIDGNSLTFSIVVDGMIFSIELEFEGTDYEGTLSAVFGSFPMTGSLIDGPE